MLSFRALVRFALSGPPTRERREILFAKPKKKDRELEPQAPDQKGGVERGEPDTTDRETQSTRRQISDVLATIDFQEAVDAARTHWGETELIERMLEKDETLDSVDIEGAAEQAGILTVPGVRELQAKTEKDMRTSGRITNLDAYVRDPKGEDARRKKVSLIRAIEQSDTEKKLPAGGREQLIERMITQTPQVTLSLARASLHRLETYEEQLNILRETTMPREPGERAEVAAEIAKIAQGNSTVDESVQRLTAERDAPARSMEDVRNLRTLLKKCSKAQKTITQFGTRFWGTDEPSSSPKIEQMKREYLEHLRNQTQKFSSLLSLQLQLDALGARNRLTKAAQEMTQKHPEADGNEYLLKQAGKLYDRCNKAVDATEKLRTDAVRVTQQDASFFRTIEQSISDADGIMKLTAEVSRDVTEQVRKWKEHPLETERKEQSRREEWVARCQKTITMLLGDGALSATRIKNIRDMQKQLGDPEIVAAYDEKEMARFEFLLTTLLASGEHGLTSMEQKSEQWGKETAAALAEKGTEQWIDARRQEIDALEGDLTALLAHPVCKELDLTAKLKREYEDEIRGKLDWLKKSPIRDREKQEMCMDIGVQMGSLRTARDLLRSLEEALKGEIPEGGNHLVTPLSREAFVQKFGVENSVGCYYKGHIYLRADQRQNWRQVLHHEKAHFILSILSEQSHLFPLLMEQKFEEIRIHPEKIAVLEAQSERWGVSKKEIETKYREQLGNLPADLREERLNALYHTNLLEEALVRRSLDGEADAPAASAEDREAFEALETGGASAVAKHMTIDPDAAQLNPLEGQQMAEAEDTPADTGFYDAMEDLETIERMIENIREFGKSYPAFKGQVDAILGNPDDVKTFDGRFNALRFIYDKHRFPGNPQIEIDPMHNKSYEEIVKELMRHLKETNKNVQEVRSKLSDVTDAPVELGKISISERLGIKWLCVLDIIRIYKEICEDINGMWKSKQDKETSEAKVAITRNLPSKIFGKEIPIVGKYTKKLFHYAERRKNQLELDRVKKWNDAFKNLDADSLLDLIDHGPTKDQLRGSIELLVEKGRMDWGDPRVWKALNAYSKYKMPIEPCKNDPILRDKWLHKLISDIWEDKDMFDEWMTGNESNYDKHKKSYTHAADNYSNIAGQMSHELQFILEKFIEHKGKPEPMPEEVNPHHYEEILHYAMRNGKMSMEQKFYYLVRGVAEELIPISRLRVLAGERGELLIKFPFLDYFYQRHNTLPEVKRVAQQITESGKEAKPGAKSTMFIRLILLRDQKARERMSKAMDRAAEGLDHEDIPYLATDIDWAKMQRLLGVISGDRSKVTTEGMKNAYVGFNEKFKMFAQLARMESDRKGAHFTDSEVKDLAQSLAAYVVLDNNAMRATELARGQISLTKNHLEEGPVSNPALRTSAYRDRLRDFVWDLAQNVGMTDADLKTPGLTMKDFLANRDRDQKELDLDMRKKVAAATPFFATAFEAKIKANGGLLKQKLVAFESASFQGGKQFLDSGAGENGADITYEMFKERYPTLRVSSWSNP
ncbi:MAG: hypothetical protein PHE68_02995 [Candidatus Peribacteraceae bacterium]|nr:hypothetical protein [Candidatus Peribacteraceae bacterium]MDD5074265.1 hypothetical protein [Candidatus Peribacteraceae bacterium]